MKAKLQEIWSPQLFSFLFVSLYAMVRDTILFDGLGFLYALLLTLPLFILQKTFPFNRGKAYFLWIPIVIFQIIFHQLYFPTTIFAIAIYICLITFLKVEKIMLYQQIPNVILGINMFLFLYEFFRMEWMLTDTQLWKLISYYVFLFSYGYILHFMFMDTQIESDS